MYINLTNFFKLERPLQLPLLLVLKRASKEDVSEKITLLNPSSEDISFLITAGYIKIIVGKKGQNRNQKLRLDTKGTSFLNSLEEPEVELEDITFFDWLSKVYVKNDKQIGNGKRTKRLIASFREKSGIDKNKLAFLCQTFITDDAEQEWSFRLEYVFFKPTNAFQTRFVLEDSRLWQYYSKRKVFFDNKFKTL